MIQCVVQIQGYNAITNEVYKCIEENFTHCIIEINKTRQQFPGPEKKHPYDVL